MFTEEFGCRAGTQISLDPKPVIFETERSEGLDSSHGSCDGCEVLRKYMGFNILISKKFPPFLRICTDNITFPIYLMGFICNGWE